MAELVKLLQSNEASKVELTEAFFSAAESSTPNLALISSLDTNLNVTTTTTAPLNTTIDSQQSRNRNMNTVAPTTGGADNTDKAITNVNAISPAPHHLGDSAQHFYVDPNANGLSDVHKTLLETKKIPEEKRRLLIDQITDVTTEAHMATTLNTQENIREANERIARQQAAMGSQMPDMSKLTIDPSVMMKHFLNSMVPEMTKVVNFSKNLPGFSGLDMDDQITLVKQGIFEVMIARITLLIDHLTDTMIDPSLKMKSPRLIVRQMSPLGPFIDQFFSIAKQMNPLTLTDGEHGLFGAILVLCPDRHGLKNMRAVQSLQQLYLQALHLLMRHNHKDADELFCSLISSIPSIRKVNDDHFRVLNTIKQKSASEFLSSFPPLHRELFDTREQ